MRDRVGPTEPREPTGEHATGETGPFVLDARTMRRARRAYEFARARRALVAASPALVFTVVLGFEGGSFSDGPFLASLALYASAALASHLGQGAGAAVAPSLVFALVPSGIVRLAESAGHVCLGEACVSWCLPACVLGGLAGGALVGVRGRREPDRLGYGLAAVILVSLAGAMGCRCAGGAGLGGIALGALVGSAAPLLASRRA